MRVFCILIATRGFFCSVYFPMLAHTICINTPSDTTTLAYFMDFSNVSNSMGFCRWLFTDCFSAIPLLFLGILLLKHDIRPWIILVCAAVFLAPGLAFHLVEMTENLIINMPILIASMACYAILLIIACVRKHERAAKASKS